MAARLLRRAGTGLRRLNLGLYGAFVLYLAVLVVSFVAVMRPGHTYFALRVPNDPPAIAVALAIVLAPIPTLRMPRLVASASAFTVTVLLFSVVFPAVIFGVFMGISGFDYYLCIALVAIALVEWARAAQDRIRSTAKHVLPRSNWVEAVLFAGGLALCGYVVFVYRGPLHLVGLLDVYQLRSSAREYATSTFVYLTTIYGGAIGPLAMVYGWVHRRWPLLVVTVVSFLLMYVAQGDKRSLLMLPLVVVLLIVLRKPRTHYLVVNVMTLIIAACAAVDGIIQRPLATAIVVERTFVAPGVLAAFYHDYFVQNPFIVWSNSVLASLGLGSGDSPAFLVADYYFHDGSRANASFLADGYAQLGYAGIGVLLGVLLVSLALLERAAKGLHPSVTIAASVSVVVWWANSSSLTALVTGGGIVLIVLVFLLNRQVKPSRVAADVPPFAAPSRHRPLVAPEGPRRPSGPAQPPGSRGAERIRSDGGAAESAALPVQ